MDERDHRVSRPREQHVFNTTESGDDCSCFSIACESRNGRGDDSQPTTGTIYQMGIKYIIYPYAHTI